MAKNAIKSTNVLEQIIAEETRLQNELKQLQIVRENYQNNILPILQKMGGTTSEEVVVTPHHTPKLKKVRLSTKMKILSILGETKRGNTAEEIHAKITSRFKMNVKVDSVRVELAFLKKLNNIIADKTYFPTLYKLKK